MRPRVILGTVNFRAQASDLPFLETAFSKKYYDKSVYPHKEIEIMIKGKFKHDSAEFEGEKTKIKILLPQGGKAGKTSTLVLKQD